VTNSETSTATVLGLGAMGSALARALLTAGHPTTVWNRSADKAVPLVEQGAVRASTVAEAIEASPLTIVCLVDATAVHELLDEAGDALSGRVLVNLTSGTPEHARTLADRAVHYVDGGIMAVPPMIGGPDALVLYSGSGEAFAAHRPVLESLGAARYLGEDPGLAALYDFALLSGMYGMFAGALHAYALVGTEGVPATAFNELLVPWLDAMASTLPRVAEEVDSGDYGSDSPLAMQATGVASLIEASRAQGITPDLILPVKRLMDEAVAAGHGDSDVAALVRVMARGAPR
jgi:3-hydroxyisobutyrate dehydrogenase-like beta-hydroxyacid dehydrogenase